MEASKAVKVGFYVPSIILSRGFSKEKLMKRISDKKNFHGRILLTLEDYLVKYSKTFDDINFRVTGVRNALFPNGTIKGLSAMINQSVIDIAVQPTLMKDLNSKPVHYSYPFKILSATFMTQNAEYIPQVFGILETFSWQLWIVIFSVLITMSLMYYVSLKKSYSLDAVLLHTLAVFLRQSSILKLSTTADRLLVYSWVVGTMFICLDYDSVFLSFLAFPPTNPIKDVQQLAKAVTNGDYHCVLPQQSGYNVLLSTTKHESLAVIGRDIMTNNLNSNEIWRDFRYGNLSQNLAFIVDTDVVELLNIGKKFISEDNFLESMSAMMVRKDFPYKNVLETFVHRLMASGLFSKFINDKSFLARLPYILKYRERDASKRRLTLTDLAPAFIVLIMGYIMTFLVLAGEILKNRRKKMNDWEKSKKLKMRISYTKTIL